MFYQFRPQTNKSDPNLSIWTPIYKFGPQNSEPDPDLSIWTQNYCAFCLILSQKWFLIWIIFKIQKFISMNLEHNTALFAWQSTYFSIVIMTQQKNVINCSRWSLVSNNCNVMSQQNADWARLAGRFWDNLRNFQFIMILQTGIRLKVPQMNTTIRL